MTKPYKFQEEGVSQIERHDGRALLADDVGLGKTLQALLYMDRHKLFPAVVVCPAGLKYHWQAQAAQHCNLRAEVLEGKKPKRQLRQPSRVYIINYDILGGWMEFLKELSPMLVVGDEGHFIKSPGAIRTKKFRELCRGVPKIIMISGTPLTNRPAELFTSLTILWPKRFPNFFPFAHKYCRPQRKPWGWEFKGATNLPKLHSELKQCGMIRRLKVDVLKELPEKRRIILPVDIANRKEYVEAETNFAEWLRKTYKRGADKTLRAERLVKFGYLKRLAAVLKMGSVEDWIDNFLASTDEKLILFAIHKSIIRQLHDRYSKISVVVDGSVTGKRRQMAVEQFQRNRRTKLFLGNVQAAGTGWDGSCATTTGMVELPWTPGECIQCDGRPHRIGQRSAVSNYYIVAKDTIEIDLCRLLQSKQEVVRGVLDGEHKGERLTILDELTQILMRKKRP